MRKVMNKHELKGILMSLKDKHPRHYTTCNKFKEVEGYVKLYTKNLDKFSSNNIERVYCIINDVNERPLCSFCNKNYVNFTNGKYASHCSADCISKETLAQRKIMFIEKSKRVHGDKYDYSLVEYKNNSTNVTIICLLHGKFKQKPTNHISGKGCKKCVVDVIDGKTFIEKAIKIHGNKYDYSLVKYEKNCKKVTIICPIHGKFNILPMKHVDKHIKGGCQKCSQKSHSWDMFSYYRNNNDKATEVGTLYQIKFQNKLSGEVFFKIGITRRSIKERYTSLDSSWYMTIINEIKLKNIETAFFEKYALKFFEPLKYIPNEKIDGWTECLSCEVDLLSYINNLDFKMLCLFYKQCSKDELDDFIGEIKSMDFFKVQNTIKQKLIYN